MIWILQLTKCFLKTLKKRMNKGKNKKTTDEKSVVFLEAPPRIELGIRALQAPALPLGHGAGYLISLKKGA